jgi:hypothetical protein
MSNVCLYMPFVKAEGEPSFQFTGAKTKRRSDWVPSGGIQTGTLEEGKRYQRPRATTAGCRR